MSESLLQNYFPWSVMISSGTPYLQIHFLKMASVTVSASLLLIATSSTYLVKASVITSMYFLLFPEVLRGPCRSACILMLGSVG